MTEQELNIGIMKAFDAINYLDDTVNVLSKELIIMTQERDEYRRRWKDEVEVRQQTISEDSNN